MKNLKDLKQDILDKKFNKFYVFYGEDRGLRHHYINEISKQFNNEINQLYDMENFTQSQTHSVSLFKKKHLYVVFGDIVFAKKRKPDIATFLEKLKDETFILCYDEELPSSTLFKEFSDYITYFPCVEDKIAYQFVESELSLSEKSKKELAFNCFNNYNNILLESDKIKNYSEAKGINEQDAYNTLYLQQQLLFRYNTFHSNDLMKDILQKNTRNYAYWYAVIKNNFQEEFWIAMENIYNHYIMAYLLIRYGSWQGANKAYEYGFNWGYIKALKNLVIPYKENDLLEKANLVADIDYKIKIGKLAKEDLLDYFFCLII